MVAVLVMAVTVSAVQWSLSDDPESFWALLLDKGPGAGGALIGILVARWLTGSGRRERKDR